MNQYVTGSMIKTLRERKQLTQLQLAQKLSVSDKAISRWETGKGYPDITLVEPLAAALGISVMELMSGTDIINQNRSCNMKKMKFYICPICGNIIFATGEAAISCCGVSLQPQEPEAPSDTHRISAEIVEDEYYITVSHPMTKAHYISFVAAVKDNSCEVVKLYPEQEAEARFKINRTTSIYFYCNRHGLFSVSVRQLNPR